MGISPSKVIKVSKKKAVSKVGDVYKVYYYIVGKTRYYGITKRDFTIRMREHRKKLESLDPPINITDEGELVEMIAATNSNNAKYIAR